MRVSCCAPNFLRGNRPAQAIQYLLRHPNFPKQLAAAIELVSLFPSSSSFSITWPAFDQRPLALALAGATARAGQSPECFCKVSGLITEAEHGAWQKNDFRPYWTWRSEAFGEDRCLRIDWPVLPASGSYAQVVAIMEDTWLASTKPSGKNLGSMRLEFTTLILRKAGPCSADC